MSNLFVSLFVIIFISFTTATLRKKDGVIKNTVSRSCCTADTFWNSGSLTSDFVLYGVECCDDDTTACALIAESDAKNRIGVRGTVMLAPHDNLAIVYYGDSIETSTAGTLVFPNYATNPISLQYIEWCETGCQKARPYYGGSMDNVVKACVGDNSAFPNYIESAYSDNYFSSLSRWSSTCGNAHATVNTWTCQPHSLSFNSTGTPLLAHSHFPLWKTASGRLSMNFFNQSSFPASLDSFYVPSRCTNV